ncbi:MAG TPA: hypothetical protein VGJ75_15655 [Dongiaceae bacterium]|jgi:hypothetical protein
MDHASAAFEHLRMMEVRIEHQTELITRLKTSGEDTLQAAQKLVLLRRALEEMRLQIGQLLPTEARNTAASAS